MNKKTLIIIIISNLLVCLLSIGATYYSIAWYSRHVIEKAYEKYNHGISSSLFRYYYNMDLQREYGGPEEYRNALLAFFTALDEAKAQAPNNPLLPDDAIFADKALISTRLALLEESQSNLQKAEQYRNDAISFCKNIPWNDCSFEKLHSICARLDENFSLIKPKKTP